MIHVFGESNDQGKDLDKQKYPEGCGLCSALLVEPNWETVI